MNALYKPIESGAEYAEFVLILNGQTLERHEFCDLYRRRPRTPYLRK